MERSSTPLLCDSSSIAETAARLKKPRKPRAKKAVRRANGQSEAAQVQVWGSLDATPSLEAEPSAGDIHQRIGALTRTLHNALRELGYERELMQTRESLPDARDRLAYIARVTGEAAEKVLNAVDRARSVQQGLSKQAHSLGTRWQSVSAYTANDPARSTPAGKALIAETCAFFKALDDQSTATQSILTDIMLAQDFHDLTGQVLRKVAGLAHELEDQLVRLLLDTTPSEQRRKLDGSGLDGPIVNATGRTDVVADQAGVDNLLASLGF